MTQNITPQEAFTALYEAGYVVKAWSIEDIESYVINEVEFLRGDIRNNDWDAVIEAASNSIYFDYLRVCTESDWEHIRLALNDALKSFPEINYVF